MKIMPKVSVIVPVYNTEKYLPRCIESILAQTFTDFELILVNDGSTDNSGKICDIYASKDSRVIVIHKENGGVNRARETGVNVATTDWITFVDSDDTITNNYIELLYSNITKNIDIVIGQIYSDKYSNIRLSIENYRAELIICKYAHPFAKIIRKKLFDYTIFDMLDGIKVGEDMLMNIRLSFKTNNDIIIIKNKIYNYRYRSDSAININVHSINYECRFWELLNKSIPQLHINKCSSSLFQHTYTQWRKFCEYKIKPTQEWINCELNKYIITHLDENKRLVSKFDYILLKNNNTILRAIIITLKKLNNHLPF